MSRQPQRPRSICSSIPPKRHSRTLGHASGWGESSSEDDPENVLADGHARLATPNECSSLLFPITQQSPTVSTALNRTSREIPLVILELASPI